MAFCGPSCAVPSCASTPAVGFGSSGSKGLGWGLGSGGLGYGLGYGAGALAESSGSLGTLAGVNPSCINQIPPSEVTIQPPACVVTIPGPILSASCDPVAVGGYNPSAPGGIGGIGGFGGFGGLGGFGGFGGLGGLGGFGGLRRYRGTYGGRLGRLGGCGIICDPCSLPVK